MAKISSPADHFTASSNASRPTCISVVLPVLLLTSCSVTFISETRKRFSVLPHEYTSTGDEGSVGGSLLPLVTRSIFPGSPGTILGYQAKHPRNLDLPI